MPKAHHLKKTRYLIFVSCTYKLNTIFEHLLPIIIFCVKLLQEPLAFFCKKKKKRENIQPQFRTQTQATNTH